MFCQINFLYLTAWFAGRELGRTRLSFVCPADANLARRPIEYLVALFGLRTEVRPDRLALAGAAWLAYCAPDPGALDALRRAPQAAWPELPRWIEHHLERLPAVEDGLNVVEREILQGVAGAPRSFADLFTLVRSSRAAGAHGMGDLQLVRYLLDLATALTPAIRIDGWDGRAPWEAGAPPPASWRIRITSAGEAFLAGEDYIAANGIDRYVGGVHLTGRDPAWRWDTARSALVAATA